ncbi:hypothetical protein KCU92_g3911, partial [Aureobasidium melanogenum]
MNWGVLDDSVVWPNFGPPREDSLTASFFDNSQYSDITIKFGEHQIRAHKVILAQQSGYFATAFFSRFQVASNPVIDLGDEDDPEVLTEVLKYLYCHGPTHDHTWSWESSIPMTQCIDLYLLADKYDIPELRRNVDLSFYASASNDLRDLVDKTVSETVFVDCIARICGPDSPQLADDTLAKTVMDLCQEFSTTLLQNRAFLQRYKKGELFNNETAAAFGMVLAGRLLTSNGIAAKEADGFPKDIDPDSERRHDVTERSMLNFLDDKRLSDVTVTFSGQKMSAHKIILVARSSHFQKMLEDSPTISLIDLGNEFDPAATTAFLKDMYGLEYPRERPESSPLFFAEMCLLAKRYGLDDVAQIYTRHCQKVLAKLSFTDEFLAHVAALCGPDSSRYADTSLPGTAFRHMVYRVRCMERDSEPSEAFAKRLEEGSIFNAMFTNRFANEMLTMFLGPRYGVHW